MAQVWSGNGIQTQAPPLPPIHPIRSLHFYFISLANEVVVKINLLLLRDYKTQGTLISFDLVSIY